MQKIIEAEILSEESKTLRITLINGEVIEGHSMGIEPAFDDEGEELDYCILAFHAYDPEVFYRLRNEDIEKVEKAY